ncbi:MAG TPA: Gfo/Idh/MocA family oxidoreductase [Clostridiaceae bacterium]|nr:Gfo/Idh/MocA family oxidoreductase [Clostridiaceae bacterium]
MDSKYSVALVGCGAVARKHLRALKYFPRRLELVAVTDPNRDQARQVLNEYFSGKNIPLYNNLSDLLENIKPDILAITTPSGTHFELAKQGMSAGCNVILEKPMTLDLKEARILLNLAEEEEVTLGMGHIYRYMPLLDLVQHDIETGRFGKVFSGDVKVRWGHDQDYYDQSAWRGTWAQDGGALMNQTIHAVDLMCWLMDDEPIAVNGQIRQLAHNMEAEDHGTALLSMSTGSICMIEGTTNNAPHNQGASFYLLAEDVEVSADLRSGKTHFDIIDRRGRSLKREYIHRLLKQLRQTGGFKAIKRLAQPHTQLYYDFINALDHGTPPRADAESGVQSVETVLAIYRSALEDGRTIRLPMDDFALTDMTGFFDRRTPYIE